MLYFGSSHVIEDFTGTTVSGQHALFVLGAGLLARCEQQRRNVIGWHTAGMLVKITGVTRY